MVSASIFITLQRGITLAGAAGSVVAWSKALGGLGPGVPLFLPHRAGEFDVSAQRADADDQ